MKKRMAMTIRLGRGLGASLMLAVIAAGPGAAEQRPFADISTANWATNAVENLAAQQVLRGYPDGTFQGKRAVSRYELAAGLTQFARRAKVLIKQREEQHGPGSPPRPLGPQGARGVRGGEGQRGPTGPAGARPPEVDALEQDLRGLQADLSRLQTSFSEIGKDVAPAPGSVQDSWKELEAITRRMHRAEKPIPGILRGHERRRDR